ncbi:exodeoxyribonuclease V subunit alpha [Alkalimonas collagenimarina]|uniref:RecBCD enzyme subunit RecD n=1 Tax=Alkalimonas collagenimarina TaxID=400390 RepID=A0ABT9GXS8_9GAMM|nr:exodeoxyribonuclease V subunit alpha [Alkalimonas collagenimarina]MDP4535865.1 exodeoxyribonuclease V subunit alpha [Alkalimonas collagenimarina]
MADTLLSQAYNWAELGLIRRLDLMLARFFSNEQPDITAAEVLAIILTSEANGRGHVCLDLKAVSESPDQVLLQPGQAMGDERAVALQQLSQYLHALAVEDWLAALSHSELVENHLSNTVVEPNHRPFVLAGSAAQPLLYMRRYWQYEADISRAIQPRLALQQHPAIQPGLAGQPLPTALMRALLAGLFASAHDSSEFNWQQAACALAARSQFGIITGGPGTGKTTTVIKLLALLQALRLARQQTPLHICLAAPTGKAAARLNESVAGSLAKMDFSRLADSGSLDQQALKACIPTEVTTLHRLLGAQPDSRHFKYNQTNPLPADVVVVDEASMVDVEMMAALLQALPAQCRLYLLGDKDQLASVEAGSILGDLCRDAEAGRYSTETADYLAEVCNQSLPLAYLTSSEPAPALAQAITMLRVSYRFHQGGAIHQLATLVNTGMLAGEWQPKRIKALKQIFSSADAKGKLQLIQQSQQQPHFNSQLKSLLIEGYKPYLAAVASFDAAAEPAQRDQAALAILQLQRDFQLLAAVKQGDWGVSGLNQRIEHLLQQHQLLQTDGYHWYAGRPVLMTRNDYHLKLMNGDIGICLPYVENEQHSLRVAFPDTELGIRWVLPSRLDDVDTVFAMTVHKSQGSEFQHAVLLLPASSSPLLTRELLYTGITRASQCFSLIYDHEYVVEATMQQQVQRASGIVITTL